jgi:hypothetical protein
MHSAAKNLRIGLVSAAVGFVGCPTIAIASQLLGSVVKALKETFDGLVGTLFLIVVAAVLIEVGANKIADIGMKVTAWVLSKTDAHHNVFAAISIILGMMSGALLGAIVYRLIWMYTQ